MKLIIPIIIYTYYEQNHDSSPYNIKKTKEYAMSYVYIYLHIPALGESQSTLVFPGSSFRILRPVLNSRRFVLPEACRRGIGVLDL